MLNTALYNRKEKSKRYYEERKAFWYCYHSSSR